MLGKWVLLKVVVRSFFLQAGWNNERLQGTGLAWALSPGLRAIYQDDSAFEAGLRRHMGVFNTHPYMASLVLGVILNVELQRSGAEEAKVGKLDQLLRSFKLGVGGSYGAIGDGLFWGGLRPLALAVGALVAFYSGPIVGVLTFVAVYNFGHLLMRIGGVAAGYRHGVQVVMKVGAWQLPRFTRGGRLMALCTFGAVMGGFVLPAFKGSHGVLFAGGALAISMGSHRYLRAGHSSLSLMYLACGLTILASLAITWGQNL